MAGVPPDAFTDKGQLWGNPLYDWPAMRRDGYRWWIARFRRVFELVDLARVDHFRGFCAYWAVPADAEYALAGRWRRGPGRGPFDATREALGDVPLIAEDLGVITPPVDRLRESLGFPGMAVLQFGFTPSERHTPHVPENTTEDRVVYTGTHDHDTIGGWYASLDSVRRAHGRRDARPLRDRRSRAALGADRLAYALPARLAMVQAQDPLGLGSEARMNMPGRRGAWRWRLDAIPSRVAAVARGESRRLRPRRAACREAARQARRACSTSDCGATSQ